MNCKPIGKQTKEVVYKVYKYYQSRKRDKTTFEHQNDINLAKTVAAATGLSSTTVRKIASEGRASEFDCGTTTAVFTEPRQKKRAPKKRIEIDCFIEGIIRRKVIETYALKRVVPTLKTLTAELKEENVLKCSYEYLRQTLMRLGFIFERHSRRRVVVERPDVTAQRWKYIQDLKKYRDEGKSIIFIGDTCVIETKKGNWTGNGKGPHLIVLHAGGRDGFVENALVIFNSLSKTGDYYGELNQTNFQKWVEEKLLPNVPANSVIVMDNSTHHCATLNRKPTMTSSRIKLQEWLVRRNVPFKTSMKKCELMMLITQTNEEKVYRVDDAIKAKGHVVLRMPHLDLNPIEMVWQDVKKELEIIAGDSELGRKKEVLVTLFTHYKALQWRKIVDKVIKREDDYLKADEAFDEEFDKLMASMEDNEYIGMMDEESEREDSGSDVDMEAEEDAQYSFEVDLE